MFTDEELIKIITKCKFPAHIQPAQKVEIRDLYLEGKSESAFSKLRRLLVPDNNLREKTLL